MKRFWYLLLAISIGANAGFAVLHFARSKPRPAPAAAPPRMERVLDRHLDRMTDGLGLTDDQRARLATAYAELFPRIIDENRALHELRRRVHDDYRGDAVDPDAFRARVQRLSRGQARLDSLVTEAMLVEAEVLTAEQRRRYAPQMPWTRSGQPGGGPEERPGPGGPPPPR